MSQDVTMIPVVAEPGDATHYEFLFGQYQGEILVAVLSPSRTAFTIPRDFTVSPEAVYWLACDYEMSPYTLAAITMFIQAWMVDPMVPHSVMLGAGSLWK